MGGRPPVYGECFEDHQITRHDAATNRDVVDVIRRTIDVTGGASGSNGNFGSTGNYGTLWVIPQAEALPAENAVARLSVDDLARGISKHLLHNVWSSRSGGTQLLAPGSRIKDAYALFERTVEQMVSVL